MMRCCFTMRVYWRECELEAMPLVKLCAGVCMLQQLDLYLSSSVEVRWDAFELAEWTC